MPRRNKSKLVPLDLEHERTLRNLRKSQAEKVKMEEDRNDS